MSPYCSEGVVGTLMVSCSDLLTSERLLDSRGISILRLPSRPRDTRARWGEEGTYGGPMMGWM